MKTSLKIIFTVLLALFLLSCTSTSDTSSVTTNYKTGYSNLAISTVENAPPDVVYPDSEFSLVVELKNQGAYQLTNGKVKILGFDDKYILLTENEQDIVSLDDNSYLEGKSSSNSAGEYTFLTFQAESKSLFPGSEQYSAPYFIQADYSYQTELTQTVCINPKYYDIYDSGCEVDADVSFTGQGSPLAITDMEELISPGSVPSVEFRFKLSNKGKGKIKQVQVNKATLGSQSLTCEFKSNPNTNKLVFDFKDKEEAVLICKATLKDQSSYSTALYLDLPFTYSLQEKKTLTIKK